MDQEMVKPDLEGDLEELIAQKEALENLERSEVTRVKREEIMDQELVELDLEEDSDPKFNSI
jgi:hypothetical protein